MKLVFRFGDLIRDAEMADYAEREELGNVSRARVTQIMNLLMLAPDIQEQILRPPRVTGGRDPIHLRQLQTITLVPDLRKQLGMWHSVCRTEERR